MSVTRILQTIIIANNALADAVAGEVDTKKIGGIIDILGMLEKTLATVGAGDELDA